MEFQKDTPRANRGIVSGVIIALILGALIPVLAVFQISLLVPVLMLGGIFAVWLKQRSGWIPAMVLLAAATVSSAVLLGTTLTLILAAAALVPGLAVIRNVSADVPFFEQVRLGVVAFGVGLMVAILIAYLYFGAGMVARFVDLLRAEYDRMPDAAMQPLVDMMNNMIPAGSGGVGQGVTVAYFRSQLSGVLDLLQETYAEMLPGTLLSGALLSGLISVFWGNWTLARRGMASEQSFVGMSGWFMPSGLAIGALVLLAAGFFMMMSGQQNGATVYMTISQTAGAAFAVQALCALDRRLLRAGMEVGRRRTIITLIAVCALLFRGAGSALGYVGAASALFGSHGAIKLWVQKRQEDQSGHDDPDE